MRLFYKQYQAFSLSRKGIKSAFLTFLLNRFKKSLKYFASGIIIARINYLKQKTRDTTVTITMKELARHIGVSPATVSLALQEDSRVAQKTRERVKKIAAKMDYIPNRIGQSLRIQRSHTIGCFISSIADSFYGEIVDGIGEIASANGYGLLMAMTANSREISDQQIRSFREKQVDGVIVAGNYVKSQQALMEFEKSGIPVVICSDHTFNECIPCVVTDDAKGGAIAAEYLLSLGHKRLAYCFGDAEHLRYQGAKLAMERFGQQTPEICASESDLIELMNSSNSPTGIMAYSDNHAILVKNVIEKMGLQIPNDISLIGYDDIWLAGLKEFSFTTMAQERTHIGKLSTQLLLDRISGKEAKSIYLEPALVVRNSTAPSRIQNKK